MKKTIAPVLPTITLHRPSLVQALSDAIGGPCPSASERTSPYKLVLLCAPAGYGKTTLLADFVRHVDIPACWYFLERDDTDAIQFLELLVESIRQRFPQFGATLAATVGNFVAEDDNEQRLKQRLEAFIDTLVATISAEISERFILMLCNYHEINHSQLINGVVNRFIRNLPPQCTLILESRAVPSLEFVPLLVRREMFGMGSEELQFTAQEIRELAHLQGIHSLTDEEASHLVHSFNGWITGILLGTRIGDLRSPRRGSDYPSSWGSPAVRMDRQYLFAYLVDEVFSGAPDHYAFLKDAVILRQMTPSLCNELLDISDAAMHLAHLEQQGLFVTCYGEESEQYYVCHPVLRELLYDDLCMHSLPRFIQFHLRAMKLFQTSGDIGEAIYHALAAQAYDQAVSLIEGICELMFARGYTGTLTDWIDALPPSTVTQHPRLLLMRAHLFLAAGELASVLPLLDAALTALEQDPANAPVLQAKILILRGTLLFRQGNYLEAQDLCRQALARMPADNVDDRAEAHLRLGTCACLLGHFTRGIVELQQALQLCGHDIKARRVARLHSCLATAYSMIGQDILSEHHRRSASESWEALQDEWGKLDCLIGLAVMKHRQGALAEAERILTDLLATARGRLSYRRGEAYILVSLGDLYRDQELLQQAISAFEKGLVLAHQVKDTYLINYTLCALSLTYLFMGDPHSALQLVAQDNLHNESEQSYEFLLRKLTLGTILLWQQHYNEALPLLREVEAAFRKAKLKREQLQAQFRLGGCLLGLGERTAAIRCLQEAIDQAQQGSYESPGLIEIRRIPDLAALWQEPPQTLSALRALLSIVDEDTSAVEEVVRASEAADAPTARRMTRPTIHIQALGEPVVLIDGEPVARWHTSRAMELFFFLLHAGQPVRKEQIIVDLWPDADDQTDQKFRSSLHYLRKILGASSVISHGGMCSLDLAAVYGEQVRYDVADFLRHQANAISALKAEDDQGAQEAFREMTALYRGDYVTSFYSDWCIPYRNKLRHAYIDAHHQLALIAWRCQDFDQCLHHWQHLLTVDSCLEEAHYGLMRCYIQQGKRGLALRQYQRCVAALRDELAVAPGQAIQRLYQRLTQQASPEK